MGKIRFLIAILTAAFALPLFAADDSAEAGGGDSELVKDLQTRVSAGDADAMYTLATMEQYGQQVPLDLRSAQALLTQAASRKNPLAESELARMYLYGNYGSDYMPQVAFEMLLEYAKEGNPLAMIDLAYEKKRGFWLAKDPDGAKTLLAKAAEIAKVAADRGEIVGLVSLGRLYGLADGPFPRSPARAALLQTRAMEKGYARGAADLFFLYGYTPEIGGTAAGLRVMRKAANAGDADAEYTMGWVFAVGFGGIDQDNIEARKWFELAAKKEHCEAFAKLAWMYQQGLGVAVDVNTAKALLERGKSHGHAACMRNLGFIYAREAGSVERARDLLQRATDLNDIPAMHYLAGAYWTGTPWGKDYLKAFQLTKRAADLDDADSLYTLNLYYCLGIGTSVDLHAAFEVALRAANLGNVKGMVAAGVAYETGSGVERDYSKAKYWFDKAAAAGDAQALCFDGRCYLLGEGTDKDEVKGRQLISASATAGCPQGMFVLGLCLAEGAGGEKDVAASRMWIKKAADEKDPKALEWLQRHPEGQAVATEIPVTRSQEAPPATAPFWTGGTIDLMRTEKPTTLPGFPNVPATLDLSPFSKRP